MSAESAAPAPALAPARPALVRRRVRGRVLLLLCGFYAISYLDRANIATATPAIRSALHLSDTQVGLVLGAFSIPYAFLQVAGGWLGDRWGARRTLAWLALVWALATVMTGLASGLVVLFAARLLLGLGESAGFPTATSAMSRWLPAQLRGNGQGLVHAASRLATALAPLLVAWLIAVSSWRTSFVLVGLLSIAWGVVWALTHRDSPRQDPRVGPEELAELAEGGSATSQRAARTPWREFARPLLPVAVVDFCYGWLLWVYITWLPTVFKDDFHLALGQYALYTTLVLLAGVLGDLAGGHVADRLATRGGSLRWARRLPLVVGLGGSGAALVPALLSRDLAVVTVSLAVAYFLLESTNSTLWALPMDIAPDHAGAASGLMNTGYGLAGVLSPVVFGWVLDLSGATWHWPMLLALALLVLGVLVALRVDPARRTTAALADPLADPLADAGTAPPAA